MMSWPELGIINWLGEQEPEYDLSWLDEENFKLKNTDLSLLRPDETSIYGGEALWIDDFRDRDEDDPDDQAIFEAVDNEVIPPTALVWGATKNDEDKIDDLYNTHLIPKIYFSQYDWWVCQDFEYTQAVIDKVKELDPNEWKLFLQK